MLTNTASAGELTLNQIFATVGSHNNGVIFDKTNRLQGYCHRDFTDQKLRLICMNTSETADQPIGQTQLTWLRKVLSIDAEWKVVILSHIPLDWWGTESEVYQILDECKDKIICNIHGHTHSYATGVLGNTGIPRVALPNICFYYPNIYTHQGYGDGTAAGYGKVAGSESDTAFCVITVDAPAGKLYADHYGAGIDREVTLPR